MPWCEYTGSLLKFASFPVPSPVLWSLCSCSSWEGQAVQIALPWL